MSRHALVREHQQANSRAASGPTEWGPVHIYRTRSSRLFGEALVGGLAGLASGVRRRRFVAALALLAAAGTVAVVVLTELSPSAPRPSAARRGAETQSAVAGAVANGHTAAQSRSVTQRSAPAPAGPTSTAQSSSHVPVQRPSQRVSPAAATQLEATGHQLLHAGHAAAAVPILQRAVTATGERKGACREPADQNCLTYAFALYDLGHALRLSGHPAAAVPILERRLRIDNQRGAVAAELLLALRGSTG
jgi:hypothetical protein